MIEEARSFLWHHARVLEQRRFEFLFDDGPVDPVLHALLAYRNADGGFGHALEPDGRGPNSQPLHVFSALSRLDELGLGGSQHALDACDYLLTVTFPDGGVSGGAEESQSHPHSPWWGFDGAGSLLPTALISALLHKNEVDHPWLNGATEFCWERVEALTKTHPYEANACARFLDHVPDRERAEAQMARIGGLVRDQHLVDIGEPVEAAEGYSAAEVHQPTDYVPEPSSSARSWFSDEEMDRSLAKLAAGQREDGGWTFAWPSWTPVTKYEWGPIVTIEALLVLKAYGRLG
ncbi:MAG: hypothetical protein ABIQ18_12440 [Umezawaea sp.]